MEVSAETWRVKRHRNRLLGKSDGRDESGTKTPNKKNDFTLCLPTGCKSKDPERAKSRERRRCCKKRRDRDPSMLSLATSLNDNCCLCINSCARYIMAIFRCVGCFVCCRMPPMQFEQLLCEMLEATGGAVQDIFCFIKKFIQMCLCVPK